MITKFIEIGKQFYLIAGLTSKGISLLFSQKYFESLQQLHHALIKDEILNLNLLSRKKTISKFISIGCDLLYKKVENEIFLKPSNNLISMLKMIKNLILISFDFENIEIYEEIKKRFLGLFITIETILTKEQKEIMFEIKEFFIENKFNLNFKRKDSRLFEPLLECEMILESKEDIVKQLYESNSKIQLFLI